MPPEHDQTRELLKALMGTKCVCGASKKPKTSHCAECYYSLPLVMRRSLYRRFREGYEEAYDASVQKLKALGRIKKGEGADRSCA